MVEQGEFREDLFYRINVIPIFLPPLRERKEDIPLIVEHFLNINSLKTGKQINGVSREVMDIFFAYNWPGNVRELRSVIEYAFVVCDGPVISKEHLMPSLLTQEVIKPKPLFPPKSSSQEEKQIILKALEESGGNRTKAAKMLGYSRVTLWKKMKKNMAYYQITINKQARGYTFMPAY